jgi:hypothetical protein
MAVQQRPLWKVMLQNGLRPGSLQTISPPFSAGRTQCLQPSLAIQVDHVIHAGAAAVPRGPLDDLATEVDKISSDINDINCAYMKHIGPLLDELGKARTLLGKYEIPTPTIVVLGNQSSGKSSVLEAISGIKLPRGGVRPLWRKPAMGGSVWEGGKVTACRRHLPARQQRGGLAPASALPRCSLQLAQLGQAAARGG